ncbi:MAG: alpha/beta hydrolase [Thermodesulfobacteriota bacterium]
MSSLLSVRQEPAGLPERRASRGVGVVLVHGKAGSPRRHVVALAEALERAGRLVEIPEMPWSRTRAFDRSYDEAMDEIAAAVGRLESRGAVAVAVAGHSLGANAVMAFAARRPGLLAVVALAPGHTPELTADLLSGSLDRARAMVAEGRGRERAEFLGAFQGRAVPFAMRAVDHLSYDDPDGPAVMPRNAAAWAAPLPFLWVVGDRDPMAGRGPEYAFAKAPAHPRSRYLTVPADHFTAPEVAAGLVVEWLLGLD